MSINTAIMEVLENHIATFEPGKMEFFEVTGETYAYKFWYDLDTMKKRLSHFKRSRLKRNVGSPGKYIVKSKIDLGDCIEFLDTNTGLLK